MCVCDKYVYIVTYLYMLHVFITNTHKLSNMVLEIKPYHVDIIMKQMWIVYKTKHTNWCEDWIFKFSPTSSNKLSSATNSLRLAVNLVFMLSSSRIAPLNWFINLNHSVLIALDMRTVGNSTTSSWKWMWLFTVVYDSFCPITYSSYIIFFCKQSSRILEFCFSNMIISVIYRW